MPSYNPSALTGSPYVHPSGTDGLVAISDYPDGNSTGPYVINETSDQKDRLLIQFNYGGSGWYDQCSPITLKLKLGNICPGNPPTCTPPGPVAFQLYIRFWRSGMPVSDYYGLGTTQFDGKYNVSKNFTINTFDVPFTGAGPLGNEDIQFLLIRTDGISSGSDLIVWSAQLDVQSYTGPSCDLDASTLPVVVSPKAASLEETEPPPPDEETLSASTVPVTLNLRNTYLMDSGVPAEYLQANTEDVPITVESAELVIGGLVAGAIGIDVVPSVAYWYSPACDQRFEYIWLDGSIVFRVSLRSDIAFEHTFDGPVSYYVTGDSTLGLEEYEP